MIRRFLNIWRAHPLLSSAFVLALLFSVFFTVRMIAFAVYWSDPAHRNQQIEGWMTPRYVAYSWSVPPEIVATALGIPRDGIGRHKTLADIATVNHIDVDTLALRIQVAIDTHRASSANDD